MYIGTSNKLLEKFLTAHAKCLFGNNQDVIIRFMEFWIYYLHFSTIKLVITLTILSS